MHLSLSPPSIRAGGQGAGGGGRGCPPGVFSVPGPFAPSRMESWDSFSWCHRPVLPWSPLQGWRPSLATLPPPPRPCPRRAGLRLWPRLACSLCPALTPRACSPPGWHPLPLLPDVCPSCPGTMWCLGTDGGSRLARLGSGAVLPWGPWPACPVEMAGPDLIHLCPVGLQWDGLSWGLATGSLG